MALTFVACGASAVPPTAQPTAPASAAAVAPNPTPRTPLPAGTRLEDLAAQFAYDASAPIGIIERGSGMDGTLTMRDVEFSGTKSGRARAYLITPPASGPHPGMVFVAGSNQRREDIRADALAVARRGWSPSSWSKRSSPRGGSRSGRNRTGREEAIDTVIDTRPAIDLLVARADVDRARIGYYGFSYGAWLGAISAAVDKRVSLVVLRSGGPQILGEIARASGRTPSAEYSGLMATVDQMTYAPHVAGPVLVQNGSRDMTYTAEQMRAWQERIGGTKTMRTYDAGHTLDATANADALTWITERWRLSGR